MIIERLSPVEAAYVALEHRGESIQVGAVGLFEAGPLVDGRGELRLADVRARIESRLHLLPRLRQRVAEVPLGLARPVWVDDTDFDIADHVDSVHLWAPFDEQALLDLVAELHMRPLDPLRPMWHLCFVTGLDGGRVALVQRASHALIDGVSGVDLATVLLDLEPDAPALEAPPWTPAPPPSGLRVVRQVLVDEAATPLRLAALALGAARHPTQIVQRVSALARTAVTSRLRAQGPPSRALTRPVGGRHRLDWMRQDLDAVRAVGRNHGATVNDVVLTAVAGAIGDLLAVRGEVVAGDGAVTALVPMSLRRPDEHGALGNRVGSTLLPLPLGIADPAARLDAVARLVPAARARHEAEATDALVQAAGALPPPLITPLSALLDHQHVVHLVVTNVAGPAAPLYALGARLLEAFPMVPLTGSLSLGVAVLSYDGALTLGITSDTKGCPDVDVFLASLGHAFDALVRLATPS